MEFLIALTVATGLAPVAAHVGRRTGLVDRPTGDDLKIHRAPVPLLGGVAVLIATAVALLATGGRVAWAIGIGVVLATAVGTLDDAWPLPAGLRLFLQGAAGLALATALDSWNSFGPLGTLGLMFLVVACANGVNIVDGQDGLAGGLGAISAAALGAVGAILGAPAATGLGLALAGGLTGFLLWNRPPARVFLGDGGAYGVGTLLAALSLQVILAGGWRGWLAAAACLGIFGFDLVFTVSRRLRFGTPLTQGDRLHSYDLVADRVGRKTSTLILLGLGVVAGLVGVIVAIVPAGVGLSMVAVGAAVLAVLGWWLWTGRLGTTSDDGEELRPDSEPVSGLRSYPGGPLIEQGGGRHDTE
jgi:UDP-GlcNAc:undecaprenyl-phosphate GlcNAc-1-phosphate transferase